MALVDNCIRADDNNYSGNVKLIIVSPVASPL